MSDVVHATKSALPAPPQVVPAGTPGAPGLTAIVVAVVIVAALYLASEVLIPITLAFLLCFLLSPLVDLLRRIRLGRIPSVIIAVILALGIILALGSAIGTQVAQLAKNIPQYQTTIENKIGSLRESTVSRLSDQIKNLSRRLAGEPVTSPPTAHTAHEGAGPISGGSRAEAGGSDASRAVRSSDRRKSGLAAS